MKILITRAAGPANKTAGNLSSAGHEAVILPLVEYRDIPVRGDDAILSRKFDGVAFTSAEAVNALERRFKGQEFLHSLYGLPVFCVGGRTSEVAREAGFTRVQIAGGDVRSLAALIKSNKFAGSGASAQIFYPAPRHKHENLSDLVIGHEICELVVYEAILVDPGRQELDQALAKVSNGAAFFYSGRSVNHFLDLVEKHGLHERLKQIRFVAISENVAQIARQRPDISDGIMIIVANLPNEKEMISCLSDFN
ncbi:MAG: uroporphyrinogen-III synthase [Rhizobiaceae bacterium]